MIENYCERQIYTVEQLHKNRKTKKFFSAALWTSRGTGFIYNSALKICALTFHHSPGFFARIVVTRKLLVVTWYFLWTDKSVVLLINF